MTHERINPGTLPFQLSPSATRASSTSRIKRKTAVPVKKPTLAPVPPPAILTIGHSTRTIEEFIRLLQAHAVTRVVDVRTVPRSRHNPQFNRDTLPASLKTAGIGYAHMGQLGGLRHTTSASINTGWRNHSFRGYADYMQTPEFERAIGELINLSNRDRIAVMCAEAVPWRCHRSLIADALLVRGISSGDISSPTRCQVHSLTPFAKVEGINVTYPPETGAPKKSKAKPSPEKPAKSPTKRPAAPSGKQKQKTAKVPRNPPRQILGQV